MKDKQKKKQEAGLCLIKMVMKIGIDTNVFIRFFDSRFAIEHIKFTLGNAGVYTHPKCLWEIYKNLKRTNKDPNYYPEGDVGYFINKNKISLTKQDLSEQEIKDFEMLCLGRGINCHNPDSEIVLAFNKEGIEVVYSQDSELRKASRLLGMKTFKLSPTKIWVEEEN